MDRATFNRDLDRATVCYYLATVRFIVGGTNIRAQRGAGVRKIYVSASQIGWDKDSVITVIEHPIGTKDVNRPLKPPPGFVTLLQIQQCNNVEDPDGEERFKMSNYQDDSEAFRKYRRFFVVDGWHRVGALELLLKDGIVITFRMRVLDPKKIDIFVVANVMNQITGTINETTFLDFITGVRKLVTSFHKWMKAENKKINAENKEIEQHNKVRQSLSSL